MGYVSVKAQQMRQLIDELRLLSYHPDRREEEHDLVVALLSRVWDVPVTRLVRRDVPHEQRAYIDIVTTVGTCSLPMTATRLLAQTQVRLRMADALRVYPIQVSRAEWVEIVRALLQLSMPVVDHARRRFDDLPSWRALVAQYIDDYGTLPPLCGETIREGRPFRDALFVHFALRSFLAWFIECYPKYRQMSGKVLGPLLREVGVETYKRWSPGVRQGDKPTTTTYQRVTHPWLGQARDELYREES